jgi:hypothetical protein
MPSFGDYRTKRTEYCVMEQPSVRLVLPPPKDSIECRYLYHIPRREGMHGVNMTRAGTKQRKTIRWKEHF